MDPIADAIFEDFSDDPITRAVIGAAIEVHKALGPGLLESAYHACLVHLLRKQGRECAVEVALPIIFDGLKLDCGYRMDLVVDGVVVVEVKSVEKTLPIHEAQLLTYLRLSGLELQRDSPQKRNHTSGLDASLGNSPIPSCLLCVSLRLCGESSSRRQTESRVGS